jgi:hypothetical protein
VVALIVPGINSFYVGAPLFSLEWWVCFLVRGVWFSSRLPLEGTNRIQNFLP